MFRLPRIATALVLSGSLALFSLPAAALDLPSQPVLTLAAAQQILTAAQTKAQTAGWPCVIAVVDNAGMPILLARMDNAAVPAGVELAPGKARTAALFRRPSGALEDAINGTRPAAITAQGFVLMRGGFPIIVNGHTVGAVGVSADTPPHDEEIAQAGLAAFK